MNHDYNNKRVTRGRVTVGYYKGLMPGEYDGEDKVTPVIDLIADLLHYVDHLGGPVFGDEVSERAFGHYYAEQGEGDDIEQDWRAIEQDCDRCGLTRSNHHDRAIGHTFVHAEEGK